MSSSTAIDSAWFAGDADSVLDEIESFLTGARSAKPSNRVLSTVLFTDIVGSTEREVVGDRGPDLLFVPTRMFPIDLIWDEPTVAGHLRRLASFSRLILTDLLGAGSSDCDSAE